jgi:CBS domain-containing protein
MTTKVVKVTPDSSIGDAANLMLRCRISGLRVLDKNGYLVGMVTEGDLLRRGETGTARLHPRRREQPRSRGRDPNSVPALRRGPSWRLSNCFLRNP